MTPINWPYKWGNSELFHPDFSGVFARILVFRGPTEKTSKLCGEQLERPPDVRPGNRRHHGLPVHLGLKTSILAPRDERFNF